MEVDINYMAVGAAALSQVVLGFLWYGPLFGKMWMKMMGLGQADMDKAKGGMSKSYALMLVGSLVGAYVLAHFVQYAGAVTASDGMQTGFWAWLGFVAPVTLG